MAQLLVVAPLDTQVLISMIIFYFYFYDLIVCVVIVGNWVDNKLFEIPAWKIDLKHFEEAHARARALAR